VPAAILADVEEAEGSAQAKGDAPSGRLVGFGRLLGRPPPRQSRDVGLRKRYPRGLRPNCGWTDRMVNWWGRYRSRVSELATLPTPAWLRPRRRDAADRGRLVRLSNTRGRARQRAVDPHETIPVRRHDRVADWRFVEDGREIRVACTPRFATNSADAAIQYASRTGGLTRVLAYQAARRHQRRPAQVVLAQFEQPPLRSTSSIDIADCLAGAHLIDLSRHQDWHSAG